MRTYKGLFCLSVLFLVGCVNSAPTNYYLLTPTVEVNDRNPKTESIFGLGPITLPDYLDRKGIVTRERSNIVKISDFDMWAESLSTNVGRVLAANLTAQGIAKEIKTYPFPRDTKINMQVALDIASFERVDGSDVHLVVRLRGKNGDEHDFREEYTQISVPCSETGYEATVSCMSIALRELSAKIAEMAEKI